MAVTAIRLQISKLIHCEGRSTKPSYMKAVPRTLHICPASDCVPGRSRGALLAGRKAQGPPIVLLLRDAVDNPLAFPPAMQIASERGEGVGVPPRPPLPDCTLLLPVLGGAHKH